jgi:hypothetical protein
MSEEEIKKEKGWNKDKHMVWINHEDFIYLVDVMPYAKSFAERFSLYLITQKNES